MTRDVFTPDIEHHIFFFMTIRQMTNTDVGFAVRTIEKEGWDILPADIQRFVELNPQGCFVLDLNSRPIGMICSICFRAYGFLGNLLVDPEYRKRGLGRKLMVHALEYLDSLSVRHIELDAVYAAAPLYRRLGFRDKYVSKRMIRHRSPTLSPVPANTPVDIPLICELDATLTGIDRTVVLQRLIDEYGGCIAVSQRTELNGFGLVRPAGSCARALGPIIAKDMASARTVVERAIASHGDLPLILAVPDGKRDWEDILIAYGFRYVQPSLRMYHGPRLDYEASVYAFLSPDKG